MPELEHFDTRLEVAVHAFADRAQTSVNAAATAERVMRRRRTRRLSWLGVAVPVPVSVLIVLAMLVAFTAWSVTGGGPFRLGITLGPTPSPTAAPTPPPTPSPTPVPTLTVAPDAAAHVTGTGSSMVQSAGTTTLDVKGIAHTQGIVIAVTTETDDPRVTGTGTYHLSVDASAAMGFAAGTFRLITADGVWEGSCTGTTRDDLRAGDLACWLAGTGSYAGMTFYFNHRFAGELGADALVGTILPAEAPPGQGGGGT